MKTLAIALATLVTLVARAPASHAEDAEWALSLGPSFRGLVESTGDDGTTFRSAPGALVRVRYGIGDFFQLGAAVDLGVGLKTAHNDLTPIGAAFLEAHYVIDIVTWVPFVTVGVGALVRGERAVMVRGDVEVGGDVAVDLALAIGGGLEYRPAREWAVGFSGRYELVVTDLADTDSFSLALFYTHFFE